MFDAEESLDRAVKQEESTYVFFMHEDGKWYNAGLFTVDGIEKVLSDLSNMKGVVKVAHGSDKNFADKQNRQRMIKQVKEPVQKYAESRQFGQNWQRAKEDIGQKWQQAKQDFSQSYHSRIVRQKGEQRPTGMDAWKDMRPPKMQFDMPLFRPAVVGRNQGFTQLYRPIMFRPHFFGRKKDENTKY